MAPLGYGSAALAYGPDATTPAAEANAALATGPVYNHTFWAQGFGVSADYDGGSDTSAVDATMGGIIAGVDMIVDNWLVGAALGYTQSSADVDELASSSDVDSALVALYAGTSFGPRNVRLGGSYAFSQVDASRTIAYPGYSEQAKADYNAGVGQVFAEISHGFAVRAGGARALRRPRLCPRRHRQLHRDRRVGRPLRRLHLVGPRLFLARHPRRDHHGSLPRAWR